MRVVIAEDSAVIRAGLAEILADRGHVVVAAVGNAEDLQSAVDEHHPDAAVVDVRMPPGYTDEGIRAAIAIRRDHPGTGVLVFSQYIETRHAANLLGAASGSGAAGVGYLLKDRVGDVSEFVEALSLVAAVQARTSAQWIQDASKKDRPPEDRRDIVRQDHGSGRHFCAGQSRLPEQHLAFQAVWIAEEDAQRAAEVVDRAVARSGFYEPVPDGLEGLCAGSGKPDMIDAPAAPHRCLTVGLGVPVDHEDIQLRGRADVDDSHRLAWPVRARRPNHGVENPLIEPA
jgi:DNA-binding NarL/FixJ family response regulator